MQPRMYRNKELGVFINDSVGFDSLNLMELDLSTNAFQKLTLISKATVSTGLGLSLLVGSYYKSALYLYMYAKRKNLSERPVNVLLLVQAIVQHLMSILMISFYITGMLFDVTISDQLGAEAWCNIPLYGSIFGLSYRVVGGFGIACYRLLCLFASDWVKYTLGSDILLYLILMLSIVIPGASTQGFAMGNGPASRKQAMWNLCIGKSEEVRNVLHDYSILQGTTTQEADIVPKIMVLLSFLAVVAELVCYLVFFGHYYLHDREMLKKKILKADVIQVRHQKNAITFLGQFWTFMTECIVLSLVAISLNEQSDISYRVYSIIGFWMEFGLVSVVEVWTSQSLGHYLPHRYILRRISRNTS